MRSGYLASGRSLDTGGKEAVLTSPLRLRFLASGSSAATAEMGG
jgi:hypothetical protein